MNNDIREWDVTDHLNSEEAIAAYLNAAREEGDPVLIQAAREDVVKAHRMLEVIQEAETDCTSLG